MFKIQHNPIRSTITAVIYEGLSITAPDGKPARLAIIDTEGNVIEAGPDVAAAAWNVVIGIYRNLMSGYGHLKVLSGPPSLPFALGTNQEEAKSKKKRGTLAPAEKINRNVEEAIMMFAIPDNPINSTIMGVSYERLSVTTPDGKPARLATIDGIGNIVDSGDDVAAVVWNVTIESLQNSMIEIGYMKVWSAPGVRVIDINVPAR